MEVGEKTSEGSGRAEPALPRVISWLSSLHQAAQRGRDAPERGSSAKTNPLEWETPTLQKTESREKICGFQGARACVFSD